MIDTTHNHLTIDSALRAALALMPALAHSEQLEKKLLDNLVEWGDVETQLPLRRKRYSDAVEAARKFKLDSRIAELKLCQRCFPATVSSANLTAARRTGHRGRV